MSSAGAHLLKPLLLSTLRVKVQVLRVTCMIPILAVLTFVNPSPHFLSFLCPSHTHLLDIPLTGRRYSIQGFRTCYVLSLAVTQRATSSFLTLRCFCTVKLFLLYFSFSLSLYWHPSSFIFLFFLSPSENISILVYSVPRCMPSTFSVQSWLVD